MATWLYSILWVFLLSIPLLYQTIRLLRPFERASNNIKTMHWVASASVNHSIFRHIEKNKCWSSYFLLRFMMLTMNKTTLFVIPHAVSQPMTKNWANFINVIFIGFSLASHQLINGHTKADFHAWFNCFLTLIQSQNNKPHSYNAKFGNTVIEWKSIKSRSLLLNGFKARLY